MIFTVRDLGFEIGPFLLEGWWALAARAVCAAVIVFAGLLVGWLLRRKIFPALLARSWHFAATPILLPRRPAPPPHRKPRLPLSRETQTSFSSKT